MPERARRGGGFLLLDLHYAAQHAAHLLREELARVGATPEWAGLLTEIRTLEPVRPTELAQRTGLAPTTLYDYLERLVAEGLVRRGPNPDDRRSFLIETTEEGVARIAAVSEAVRGVHARFAQLLGRPVEEVEGAVTELRFALEDALNRETTK
jgi:DNA-binding MarR family transcriptional regulator